MLKRQDTLLSSSSRRDTPPPSDTHHAKAIGCMAGIVHLFSKYSHRRRPKFLTFGKKEEKHAACPPQKAKPSVAIFEAPPFVKDDNTGKEREETRDTREFSRDLPRSPTLPPDIRRSEPPKSPDNSQPSPPALVSRLMGLDGGSDRKQAMALESSSSEKRRKLMSALEKCDEDLKELKKIIEAVQFAEHLPSPPVALRKVNAEGRASECGDYNNNNEQPSPVSVLDELTRSPLISNSYPRKHTNGRITPAPQQQKATTRKKPGEDDALGLSFFNKAGVTFQAAKTAEYSPAIWSSKAMVESVEQVCKDIEWGEKREKGRIGLVIQDYICRELIEEIVTDSYYLGICSFKNLYSLPLRNSKRRLSF